MPQNAPWMYGAFNPQNAYGIDPNAQNPGTNYPVGPTGGPAVMPQHIPDGPAVMPQHDPNSGINPIAPLPPPREPPPLSQGNFVGQGQYQIGGQDAWQNIRDPNSQFGASGYSGTAWQPSMARPGWTPPQDPGIPPIHGTVNPPGSTNAYPVFPPGQGSQSTTFIPGAVPGPGGKY